MKGRKTKQQYRNFIRPFYLIVLPENKMKREGFVLSARQLKWRCEQVCGREVEREYTSYDGRRGAAAAGKISRCVKTTSALWPVSIFALIVHFKMWQTLSTNAWQTEDSSENACMGGAYHAILRELEKAPIYRLIMWCQSEILLMIALGVVVVFLVLTT